MTSATVPSYRFPASRHQGLAEKAAREVGVLWAWSTERPGALPLAPWLACTAGALARNEKEDHTQRGPSQGGNAQIERPELKL